MQYSSVAHLSNQLKKITVVMDKMSIEIKRELPKIYSKELIEILFKLPYTKRQYLIDEGFGTPKTVGNYLMELENSGFLKSVKVGKGNCRQSSPFSKFKKNLGVICTWESWRTDRQRDVHTK